MIVLNLSSWDELSQNTPVLNSVQIPYLVWVKLPVPFAVNNELYSIRHVTPVDPVDIDYSEWVTRDCNRPWLCIKSDMLDTHVGKHIYQLQFINRLTNDTTDMYISYIIQLDNPPKPYYYMEKYRESLPED